MFLISKKCKPM